MKLCLAFLRDGRRAAIQGRDVGTKLASVVKRAKKPDVDGMLAYVDKWATKEIERLEKRDRDASGIADIRECILALSEGETETQAVVAKIERLFADGNETTRITLSSTHRAKGMERDRVWLLRETYLRTRSRKTGRGTVEYIEPGIEEHNLYYVATTRARRELFLVRGAA
jgi:superfamily I DNA/RNA helicase